MEALLEVAAAADGHDRAGTKWSHSARNGPLIDEMLGRLEALLIFDQLHLRSVAVLVHSALSASTISAGALRG